MSTAIAVARLGELEATIEKGLTTFVDVGLALLEIRNERLYKESHSDFDSYCRERWGWDRTYAHRHIEAARVASMLPIGNSPANEAQARELSRIAKEHGEDAARAVWNQANAEGSPTASSIRRAAEVVVGDIVSESGSDARTVVAIEDVDDERVLLGDDGEALIVGRERLVSISKPDLGNGVSHPARYSAALLPVFADYLAPCRTVLDPFAGTGRIHELQQFGFETVGVEIEPEWARLQPDTIEGNVLALPFGDAAFDAICTSPTYGNRLADHHNAADPELRRSYTHDLGRSLHEDNSGAMHWGDEYRAFHEQAWKECLRVLKPHGLFVLNIKDHIRAGERQPVSGWHVTTLCRFGLVLLEHTEVETPSMRAGSNSDLRGPEYVYLFEVGAK